MKNLKIIRKEKGLTCEELGLRVNVQKSAISKYERGEIQPSKEVLIKLAEVLDCSIDFLLGVVDNPIAIKSKTEIISKNSDAEELGTAIKKIFIDAGKIAPNEELPDEFKEYAEGLVRAAVALDKRNNNK